MRRNRAAYSSANSALVQDWRIVGDHQRRLQARDIGGGCTERVIGLLQLAGMRPVLGIENRHIVPAHAGKRIAERLWLGARRHRRHLDDLEMPGRVERADRRKGLDVVGLADQLDVEPGARPVEPFERADQLGRDLGLAVERHHHGIDGQGLFAADDRKRGRPLPRPSGAPAMHQGRHAQAQRREIEQRQRQMQGR